MKYVIIAVVVLLSGCATMPDQTKQAAIPIDANCQRVATYAKGIASIRDSGMGAEQLQAHVSVPTFQPFPITLIQKDVFASTNKPDDTFTQYYSKCIIVGYDNLYHFYKRDEDYDRLLKENAELQGRLSALQPKKVTAKKK